MVARRLFLAREEVDRCDEYDYLVVNDRLKEAMETLRAIIQAERSRTRRQPGRIAAIRRAFRGIGAAPRSPRGSQ